MSFFTEKVQESLEAVPCLFYPVAKKMGIPIAELLSSSGVQADLLVEIARSYPVSAVIRMTELWCEAASFGMECNISDRDFPRLGGPICSEVDELGNIKIPEIENEITSPLIQAVRIAAPRMEKPLVAGVTGPYTLCSVLNGSEDFMMNCMTDPDAVHNFLSRVTEYLIEYIDAYKSTGAAGVILAEPSASMVSPAMMEEFSNTYIQKIIEKVQDDSFSLIYHNCGAVNNRHLEIIARLDADVFHFGNEVDLGQAFYSIPKDRLILGNIDPRMFIMASPQEIENQTVKLIRSFSENSQWRLSTGCDLSPNASMEKIEHFLDVAHQLFSQK